MSGKRYPKVFKIKAVKQVIEESVQNSVSR